MDEREVERALKQWASRDDVEYREDLLKQCLAMLGQDEGELLDDDRIDMLAAAGDVFCGIHADGNGGLPREM